MKRFPPKSWCFVVLVLAVLWPLTAGASSMPFNTNVNMNVGIGTSTPQGALTIINGNVGIGTWAPAYRLDVKGTTRSTAFAFVSEYDNGSKGGAAIITWDNGNKQKVTLTGTTTHGFTFVNPSAGVGNYLLKIVQGSGTDTIPTWAASSGSVKWPATTIPTLTTTNGAVDFVNCYFDGTDYYCTATLGY